MKIGYIIKSERLRNKLSQEEVAKAIGSTKQAVYKYETGIVTNIPMDKISKMATLFGVTPAYLMGWEETSADENTPTDDFDLTDMDKMFLELLHRLSAQEQLELLNQLLALSAKRPQDP